MTKRRRRAASPSIAGSRSSSPAPAPSAAAAAAALPMDKKSRFDRRFDTAKLSPAEVLRTSLSSIQQPLYSYYYSEKQKELWSSTVYDHFHPPEILTVGENVKYVFVCKRLVLILLFTSFVLMIATEILRKRSQGLDMTRAPVTSFDTPTAVIPRVARRRVVSRLLLTGQHITLEPFGSNCPFG
jgi:hypothetical protein